MCDNKGEGTVSTVVLNFLRTLLTKVRKCSELQEFQYNAPKV